MTVHVPDRFKAANAFWIGLAKIGLTPAAVLSQARLPVTVYDGKKNLVTTAQFFALWRAVGELSSDPAAGLKIATQIDPGDRPPSTMAAFYSRDYRDALTRLARFKQLCSPEELQIKTGRDECTIEPVWLRAQEETPSLLTDAAFASFVELGRRGTGHPVKAKRVELKRSAEKSRVHEAYFNCPIKFKARRNMLVLHAGDLDRPFATYNAELLEMLNPQLERALEERRAQSSISEQVKWILKRLLAGSRPEISAVARELGLSDRTLQRRIVDDGASFRELLLEAGKELAREYLTQIVLALAIGEAFKQYFPERKDHGHRTILPDSTPALIAFIILIVTFYLGMDRYFFKSYITLANLPNNDAVHLMGDSILFMLESALFFSMSRNLHADRWRVFYLLVFLLLIVDIVWCIHCTIIGPSSFRGWMLWDVVFMGCIGVLWWIRPKDIFASWIGVTITLAITLISYKLFWPLYFA